mgnify:CR=1 FL=1
MAYNVFESTNMGSTRYAERILDCVADVDIENGTFGYLNGLIEGRNDLYNFVAGVKAGEKVVVADQPAWTEDTSRRTNQRKDKFVIEAGVPFRVRIVKVTDNFSTAVEGFTPATRDAAAPDKWVTIDEATGKLVVADAPVDGAVMNAKIEKTRILGGMLTTPVRNYGYTRKMYDLRVESMA